MYGERRETSGKLQNYVEPNEYEPERVHGEKILSSFAKAHDSQGSTNLSKSKQVDSNEKSLSPKGVAASISIYPRVGGDPIEEALYQNIEFFYI